MKNFFLLILTIVLIACQQQSADEKLPILGNKIYEENDTIYHTIEDFRFVDQDSSVHFLHYAPLHLPLKHILGNTVLVDRSEAVLRGPTQRKSTRDGFGRI